MILNLITKNSKYPPIFITSSNRRYLSAGPDHSALCDKCKKIKHLLDNIEVDSENKVVYPSRPKAKVFNEPEPMSAEYFENFLKEYKVILEEYFEYTIDGIRSGPNNVYYEECLEYFNNSLKDMERMLFDSTPELEHFDNSLKEEMEQLLSNSNSTPELELLIKKYGLHQPEFLLDFINSQSSGVLESLLKEDYFSVYIFMNFAIFLSVLIVSASYFLVTQKPESEKLSTYECGFEPYEDAKNRFDVQFYVIAILFVLFDIEIIVLLPWCLELSTQSMLGYWSMIEFILELGLGFVYVWSIGALDW